MKKSKKLLDEYRFPGFRPLATIKGKFGDKKAKIIKLVRVQKKLFVGYVARFIKTFMTVKHDWSGICLVVMLEFIWKLKCGELIV